MNKRVQPAGDGGIILPQPVVDKQQVVEFVVVEGSCPQGCPFRLDGGGGQWAEADAPAFEDQDGYRGGEGPG
jgi:hypothetical protein